MKRTKAGVALAILLVVGALALLAGVATYYTCGFEGCPDVKGLRAYIPDEASVVLDRRGQEVGKLFRVNREIVPLDSLPKYVGEAFVAVEDQRFWEHHGVDWRRVPGAVLADAKAMDFREGFSTITMQLARNLFPNRLPAQEKTPWRKLSEMRVAEKIEDRFTKQDILQLYLNQIYFGHGAWGIDAAAQEYFGKPARRLSLSEAATLAGLPQAPSRNNPRSDREAALARRNVVLDKMAEQGLITGAQKRAAESARLRLAHGRSKGEENQAPYFIEAVRQTLEDQLGDELYTGGLRIHTTLDLDAQRVAKAELERQLESIEHGAYGGYGHPRYDPASQDTSQEGTKYLQGALVMLDARTGDVRAWVGGRDFDQSKFDRVLLAKRQPGSAFKPFVYAAALQAGYPPTYRLSGSPLRLAASGGKVWAPQNFEGEQTGEVTLHDALVHSLNIPTVRLAQAVGYGRIIDEAHQIGIDETIPDVPSVALGVVSVTPLELTDAYAAFATLGTRPTPRLVTEVEDRDGRTIWAQPVQTQQVLDPATAFVLTSILRDVVDEGTGTAVRAVGFHGVAAGKTGTTQDGADAWFVGYTPQLVMGVWVGLDKPQTIVRGGQGGTLAAPVWGRVMARVGTNGGGWGMPAGVEAMVVDANGDISSPECPPMGPTQTEYFIQGTAPMAACYGVPPGYAAEQPYDTLGGVAAGDRSWWDRLKARIFSDPGSDTVPAAAEEMDTTRQRVPMPGRVPVDTTARVQRIPPRVDTLPPLPRTSPDSIRADSVKKGSPSKPAPGKQPPPPKAGKEKPAPPDSTAPARDTTRAARDSTPPPPPRGSMPIGRDIVRSPPR